MTDPIQLLEGRIPDPRRGLPEDVFRFATRITPMINVDLLIQDGRGATLLTWRDDGLYPAAWHLPGGIIRYKERITDRIRAVALSELGASVTHGASPLAIEEFIHPERRERGHFISLLYACTLLTAPDPMQRASGSRPRPGQWAWHAGTPGAFYATHERYRAFLERIATDSSGAFDDL